MRILSDQHVASKYVTAFESEPGITVSTVREELTPDATDKEIAALADSEEWVLFTNDDDFYRHERSFGLIVYSQTEDPKPAAVLDAVTEIDDAYTDTGEVTETVPDGWI